MPYHHAGHQLTEREETVVDAILGALPALAGTEKQIAYAQDMRVKMAVWAVVTTFGSAIRKAPDVAAYAATLAARIQQSDKLMVADAHRWIEAGQNNAGRPDLADIANGKAPL